VNDLGKRHIGGDFDEYLRDEDMLEEAKAIATKRVIAYQIGPRDGSRQHLPVRTRSTHEDEPLLG